MDIAIEKQERFWQFPAKALIPLGFAALLLVVLFYDGLAYMVGEWEREEYSHGYLLPIVTAFFIWQKSTDIAKVQFGDFWPGLAVVVLGVVVYFMGELGTLYTIVQYAFLLTLGGLFLALMGWRGFKIIWVPLLLLVFTVPLPSFLYNNLSSALQLISSKLGVEFIRLFGITVFLEGNIIDLGVMKLQVVEACNGLRYLFPLMSLGFIAAYLFDGAFWKRAVIFLSTIPITVFMNSFRIGVIGILVDNWGQSMAEGFLHDFEGWVVFMACSAILLFEMWLLAKIGKERRPFAEVFGVEYPEPLPKGVEITNRPVSKPFIASIVVLVLALIGSQFLTEREEHLPDVPSYAGFPKEVEQWQGRLGKMEQKFIDTLKFDDYVIADYLHPDQAAVNLYVAYYGSQRKGASIHSPRSCIPGGGWEIQSHSTKTVEGVQIGGKPLQVNRLLIQLGDTRQLVYYWFQQRGRVMTNEYLVKWYLFWDALTRNRTDGALVRLTTVAPGNMDIAEADRALEEFARDIGPQLEKYIPD
jgi:exosortase D (VPLPA-CTERM-specific)